jgi:hypothetical protein
MSDLFETSDTAIQATEDKIILYGTHFANKDHTIIRKDIMIDILSRFRENKDIYFVFDDGENLIINAFDTFLEQLINRTGINKAKLFVATHDITYRSRYATTIHIPTLGIFSSLSEFLPEKPLILNNDASLFGTLLGRFTIDRLNLAYQLDTEVPGSYIVFQTKEIEIPRALGDFKHYYDREVNWMLTRTNPEHLETKHTSGLMDWRASTRHYPTMWPKFKIEVVAETDAYTNFWFTEKTARCLCFGKPFLLLSGQYSLKRLRDEHGFKTFGEVIYERYDEDHNPFSRIQKMVAEMKRINSMPDDEKTEVLDRLTAIANENKVLYNTLYANSKI